MALYETQGRLYVLPAFEHYPIAGIRPEHVRKWMAGLADQEVQARTIGLAHQTLSRVLRQAVQDGILPSNACTYARPPKTERRPIRILTAAEVEALADTIEPRYRALVLTAAYGGLRMGEATALRRSRVRMLERRVDIHEGLTEVRGRIAFGPLKTRESRRSVTVPRFLVEELAAHMATYMRPAAEDKAGADLLFTSRTGEPIRWTNFRRRAWEPAIRRAGLEPAPVFHDLRHTAAALAIASGAHPKAIQARLGHASITTTLNVYGHLFEGLDDELADRLDVARSAARDSAASLLPLGDSEPVPLTSVE